MVQLQFVNIFSYHWEKYSPSLAWLAKCGGKEIDQEMGQKPKSLQGYFEKSPFVLIVAIYRQRVIDDYTLNTV